MSELPPQDPTPPDGLQPDSTPPGPGRILGLSLVIYLPMILSGFWAKAPGSLRPGAMGGLALGMVAALVLGALIVLASRWSTRHTAWGRDMFQEFATLLGGVDSRTILWLALLSALGEELLFRGVLHPRLGLLPTALLFGALHFPYRKGLWPWTVFAFGAGLVLAGLTEASGTVWPAVLLHFVINYFNLHDIAEAPPPTIREDPPPGQPD